MRISVLVVALRQKGLSKTGSKTSKEQRDMLLVCFFDDSLSFWPRFNSLLEMCFPFVPSASACSKSQ